MRVLITGVPGWLGNRSLEILSEKAWDIRCLVMEGTPPSFIEKLPLKKKIECVTGDVTKPLSLTAAVKDCDVVLHLVGVIHPKKISDLYGVNTQGTENLLRVCAESGVKRFIYISSNSVGGVDPSGTRLMTEEDVPRPYLHYGKSKHLVAWFQRLPSFFSRR